MNLPIRKLQFRKSFSIKFVRIQMAKSFPQQTSKQIHICKWISFAISTFVLVEEIASVTSFDPELTVSWKN